MLTKSIIAALGAASLAQAAYIDADLLKRENLPGYPCNRDYCLRAMVASQTPTRLEEAIADCTSYFWATETPPTSTITSTVSTTETSTDFVISTITKTFTPEVPLVKREFVLPTYAGPCSGFVRWSSVCSCLGVTSSTSTLPTPSTTVESTATETTTTTIATATVTPITFRLRRYTPDTSNNQYLQIDDSSRLFYHNTVTPIVHTYFTLDPVTGYLYQGTKVAKGNVALSSQAVTFEDPSAPGTEYVCAIAPTNGDLTCTLGNTGPRVWGYTSTSIEGQRLILHATSASTPLYFKAVA